MWWIHGGLVLLSTIMALIVPFGLAALLYVETDMERRRLNIALLVISAGALVLQVIDSLLGLRYRARLMRTLHVRLEDGISRYQDGVMNSDEFLRLLSEVSIAFVEEEGA